MRAVRRATGQNLLLQGKISACASVNRGNIGNRCISIDEDTLNEDEYCILTSGGYPSIYRKGSNTWPTREDRPRNPKLINPHKWIALATWGPPPRGKGLVVTHVCGNSFCVAAKHLRYQTETANHYDSEHHETYNHNQHHVSRLSWGVNEAYKL